MAFKPHIYVAMYVCVNYVSGAAYAHTVYIAMQGIQMDTLLAAVQLLKLIVFYIAHFQGL